MKFYIETKQLLAAENNWLVLGVLTAFSQNK